MRNSAICMLEEAAARYADRPAVEDDNTFITYGTYRSEARKIASGLLDHTGGCRPVVLYLPKSIKALETMMGILYAGRPYVPVDIGMPSARVQKLLEGLNPDALVTDDEHLDELREKAGEAYAHLVLSFEDLIVSEERSDEIGERVGTVTDADPIYIMYTSGSTGVPKGVTIPHRGILDYADWVTEVFGYTEETRMGSQSPLYFDNSTFDIYGAMRCGACVVLIPDTLFMFPVKLPEYLLAKHITSIFWVPTVMINVANSGILAETVLPDLKTVAFCGETMPNKQLNIWRKALPDPVYANLYGPTEITDVCCYYIVDRAFEDNEPLPIGRACENMRVTIITEDGSQAKTNEMGELCVSGTGVALGYWNAGDISARAFTANPIHPEYMDRMYHTGDLAYTGDDGLIYFCGRKDNQIKHRGNRIELGEIETAAMCIAGVENAAAVYDENKSEIVLFVETQETMQLRKFNKELRQYIQQYMLPGRLVTMRALPHTANDKIDRVTLKRMLTDEPGS